MMMMTTDRDGETKFIELTIIELGQGFDDHHHHEEDGLDWRNRIHVIDHNIFGRGL